LYAGSDFWKRFSVAEKKLVAVNLILFSQALSEIYRIVHVDTLLCDAVLFIHIVKNEKNKFTGSKWMAPCVDTGRAFADYS